MSELTQVELLWLEKPSRTESASVAPPRKGSSTATGASSIYTRQRLCLCSLDIERSWGGCSRIDILRAVTAGQRCSTVPYVKPGGEILLRLSGWPKVERVLRLIDAIEALGIDPADAAPDYWHHVHNRLSVNETPRAYTKSRHQVLAPSAKDRTVTPRNGTLVMTIGAVAILAGTIVAKPSPIYIWNSSESVPLGLYRMRTTTNYYVSELVAVHPPEPLATYLDRNGYLLAGVPMLKRVLALPGQTVCRTGSTITVDGIEMGEARERDSRGRPLPVWEGATSSKADNSSS